MKNLSPAYLLEVLDYGEVGAGKIVRFPQPAQRQSVSLPKNARSSDQFVTFTVNGNSLTDIGIEHGDVLLCRRNFEMSEVTPKRVCVIFWDNELYAKRLQINDDKTITIISADGERVVFADEIEVKALAVEHKRVI